MLAPTGMDQPEVASLLFVQTLICGVPLVPADSGNLQPPHITKMENLHRLQGFPKEANLYIFVGMILKDSPKDRQRFARTAGKSPYDDRLSHRTKKWRDVLDWQYLSLWYLPKRPQY